jgi:hypothetical protein
MSVSRRVHRNKGPIVLKGDARPSMAPSRRLVKVKEVGFEQVGLITQKQDG